MGVSRIEQETTIQISREGTIARVWTSDTRMIAKLDKKCEEPGTSWHCVKEEPFAGSDEIASKFYEVDKRMISFRTRPAKQRELTPEELAQLRERMQKMREAQQRAKEMGDDAAAELLEDQIEDLEEEEGGESG